MKKIILAVLVLGVQIAIAQKVAYIEMERIVKKLPAFEQATNAIDTQAKQWETELDIKFQSIESMYQEYVSNESIMSGDKKMEKQEAIFQAESTANEFKEQKFGMDGELNALQEEKFGPLYDLVFNAAEEVAIENGYDYVFSKNGDSNWIYTSPVHDLTEKVIVQLKL